MDPPQFPKFLLQQTVISSTEKKVCHKFHSNFISEKKKHQYIVFFKVNQTACSPKGLMKSYIWAHEAVNTDQLH